MSSALLSVVLVAAVLTAAAVGLLRRARRRSAELDASILRAIESRAESLSPSCSVIVEPGAVGLRGRPSRLPWPRLVAAARGGQSVEAIASAAIQLLLEPLRPLPGSFNLKIHGTRTSIHLVSSAVLALLPRDPRLASQPLPPLNLAATYRVDGQAHQCITEDHLFEIGIDGRDIHGIGLAVLRQGFDEASVRRVLESGTPSEIRSTDGTAGAQLLVIGDFLSPPVKLSARLEGTDHLTLAPDGHDWAPSEPTSRQPSPPTLTVDSRGFRIR